MATGIRALDGHYRHCAAARHHTIDFQVVFHTHAASSGQSLATWSIFAVASLSWVVYGLLNRKPAIYVGNIIGLAVNLLMVNGILMHAGWTTKFLKGVCQNLSECLPDRNTESAVVTLAARTRRSAPRWPETELLVVWWQRITGETAAVASSKPAPFRSSTQL